MYFLWKETHYGIIRISCNGLTDFVNDAMRSKLRLYSITLLPSGRKEDADMNIVLSDEDIIPELRKEVEKHFDSILRPMGIRASVVWARPEKSIAAFVWNPYLWAGIASCAVLVSAGAEGLFWAAFWGAAAWFIARGLRLIAKRFRRAA